MISYAHNMPVSGASNCVWRKANTYRRECIFLFVGSKVKVNKTGMFKALNNKGSIKIEK